MATDPLMPRGYRFGVFEVECAAAALRREGRLVRLRGKPYDILVFLLERSGELVTRDDLRQHLWGADTFVDFEHGLNTAMNRLREALGDSAENPRFIQTLPRRGYRFVAPMERVMAAPGPVDPATLPAATAPAAVTALATASGEGAVATATPQHASAALPWWRRRPRTAVAAVAVIVLAVGATAAITRRTPSGRPMIAVLPFANLSGTADQEYFSDGFTDELIAQLGALNPDELGVIARTTVSRYRDGRHSVSEIGKALGVAYVLEGGIRRSGDQVRITAALVDVSSQTQLWTETYDHDVRDVLITQRDVAMKVAGSLTMSVLRVTPVRHMPSPEAYDATLRGMALRQQATEASLQRAREYFEQAIASDPTHAPAHAGLADVYLVLAGPGWEFDRPRDLLPKALAEATRAIDLDPRLPDGYAVRGLARLWLDSDVVGAEGDIRHAIALNGSYAMAHRYLSTLLVVTGRADQAVTAARRAVVLDPLAPASGTTVAYRLYYAGDFAAAIREFDRALEGSPDYASAWIGKAQTLRALHRDAEARLAVQQALPRAGGRSYVRAYAAYSQALDGDIAGARAILEELRAMAVTRYVSPFHFALVDAGLGDAAQVRRDLAQVVADGSGWAVFVPIEREMAPFRPALSSRAP